MKFYRQAALEIRIRNKDLTYGDTILISGLRVSFSITKSLAWTTNTASIKIWNLSQTKRNQLSNYGCEVTLKANYSDGSNPSIGMNPNSKATEVLFIGDASAVSHVYDQPEIITVLECGDGEKYLNEQYVSVSYAAGARATDVLNQVASQMGIPTQIETTQDLIYRNGYSDTGPAKDVLTSVCNKLNLQWSVQNAILQVIPLKGTNNQPSVEVNENTGMQGVPQRFTYRSLEPFRSINAPNTGYKVRMALNPKVLPGSKIVLQSTHLGFKGLYRVESISHDGDTYGSTWSSNIEVTELSGET
jgi:hypothetical protein